MQKLWTEDIVDSISTASCSFLHCDIIRYGYLTWRLCLTSYNIGIVLNIS